MQIDKEILSEKNYEGTRLVEISDEKVIQLKEKLKVMQVEEVNPILDGTAPLLKILDPYYAKIADLKEKIKPILAKAKPLQEKSTELLKGLDPESEEPDPELEKVAAEMKVYIDQIHGIEAEIADIKKEMQPTKDKYEEEMKKIEVIDQRAQLIKARLVPLVNKAIEKELGEFDKALHVIEKDGKVFAEVVDQIEEKVKQVRAENLKAKK